MSSGVKDTFASHSTTSFPLRGKRFAGTTILLPSLADLHELRRSRGRARLRLAAFGPRVGFVVMVHVASLWKLIPG